MDPDVPREGFGFLSGKRQRPFSHGHLTHQGLGEMVHPQCDIPCVEHLPLLCQDDRRAAIPDLHEDGRLPPQDVGRARCLEEGKRRWGDTARHPSQLPERLQILPQGGGIARGNVVGKSDKWAAVPAERPVSPKDILATIYHLLGIDHHQTITDRIGRPLPLVEGQVVQEMLA